MNKMKKIENRIRYLLDGKFFRRIYSFLPYRLINQKRNEAINHVGDEMLDELNFRLWDKVLDDEIK